MPFFSDMQDSFPEPTQKNSNAGNAVDAAYSELEGQQQKTIQAVQEENETLTEVEVRLRKANYYRAVLDNPLFDNGDEIANEVEQEFRNFAISRLRNLLGMSVDAVSQPSAFPPDEIEVLRLWAAKLLKKPTMMQIEPASKPVSKPMPEFATQAPRLNRVTAPSEQPHKRGPGRPPGTGKNQKAAQQLPPGRIEENGRQFVEVERTDPEGKSHMIRVDVTPPVEVPGRKPMPSGDQALMMEIMKADQVQKQMLGKDLNKVISTVTGE